MKADSHDWIVVHRVRFAAPVDGNSNPFPGPHNAEAWRFYPALATGDDGMRTSISDEWGGFGLYSTQAAAQEVFENPDDHLPFLEDAVEAYHALAVPVSHRGKVNWRGAVRENDTFSPTKSDPGGPLMVITSAGYENPGPDDVPRITTFLKGVIAVLNYYATLQDNIRRAAYGGAQVDGGDGVTISLWRDDAAMMKAAYRPGRHRTELDYHRENGHFDRSSFSRARILASKGTWDGSDPVVDMA